MRTHSWGALAVAGAMAGCAATPEAGRPAVAVQDPDAIQVVRIETVGPGGTVSGARCGVKNDRGSSEILAPGVAEVIRSAKPLEILCFVPGYRVAMLSVESGGDVIGPAATGVVAGGAVSAVAALPLLGVPVVGPLMYMGAVGGSALLGGAINAADKHSQGKIYSYPPSVLVRMTPQEGAAAFQVAARPAPLEAPAALPSPNPIARPAPLAVSPSAPLPVPAAAPAAALQPLAMAPIEHALPEFPLEAARAGVDGGRVTARLSIDRSGRVTSVRILESQPPRVFDRAVSDTLARWRFAPGPDARTFDAEIEFKR